jgi:hypothetical protein
MVLGLGAWLAVGFATGGASRAVRVLRALIEYPPNYLEFFARLHPGMFLVGAVAVVAALTGYSRDPKAYAPHVYMASALVLPAIGLGFHPGAPRLFAERYVFHLNSCFVLLYAFGVWWLTGLVVASAGWRFSHTRSVARAVIATVVLVVTGGLAPGRTLAATQQQYGENGSFRSVWGEAWFIADHQGSSRYVCEHAGPDDLVVPMDVLIHWSYCPRADYQLTLSRKGDAEGWIGIRSGDSLDEIAGKVREGRAQRVWIVLSGQELARSRNDPRLATMLAFRGWECANRVYEGRDGASDVWVLDSSCLERHLP